MHSYLQRVRKAARLARRAVQVLRSDGPAAACFHTFRYLALRSGVMAQQDLLAAMTERQAAMMQWQQGLTITLTRQQQSVGLLTSQLRQQQQHLGELQDQETQSLRWLAEHHRAARAGLAAVPFVDDDAGPLITIVMPVWNRQALVGAAIESVLNQTFRNWELVVVDDGSTDGSREVILERTHDPRVRLLTQDHVGVCRARNRALREARGEIITYLDSDNEWFPGYLAEVARTFRACADADCAYAAQLVEGGNHGEAWIRSVQFQRDTFAEAGVIDLNVFAHRREMVDRFGDFDERLTRLVDWDLIIRYTRHRDPVPVPVIGGRYRVAGADSISRNAGFFRNRYELRRKHERLLPRDLRVLYVVWDYPQLTETYVRWEIACMKRWGVHVEVWSEVERTACPYASEVPVHYGSLDEAMRKVRPHVAHVHWLHIAERYHEQIARAGLQLTVRGHGFEFHPESLPRLLRNNAIQAIYVFPHFHAALPADPRIRPMTAAFNGDLYYPPPEKDPFLVVRTASAKPAKGLETFIDVARQCPQHRFVLVLGVLNGLEHYSGQLQEYNRRQGSPVDIRLNVPTEEAAALVRQAGIYLHTYGTDEPFGMPISIAEAMATGALVFAPALPGAEEYVGPAGGLYASADDVAAAIRLSARAYPEQWRERQQRAAEFAYQNYADIVVLRPLLDEWLETADAGIDAPLINDELQTPEIQPALRFLMDQPGLALIDNFGRSYLSHAVGAGRRAHEWGADADVRKAALCHSVYIDRRISPTPENRAILRERIGERAERLAYAFCAVVFVHLEPALDRQPPFEFPDQIAGGTLRLNAADFDDLCLIHLAEWTEKRNRCPDAALDPAFYRRIAQRLGGRAAATFAAEKSDQPADARWQHRAA